MLLQLMAPDRVGVALGICLLHLAVGTVSWIGCSKIVGIKRIVINPILIGACLSQQASLLVGLQRIRARLRLRFRSVVARTCLVAGQVRLMLLVLLHDLRIGSARVRRRLVRMRMVVVVMVVVAG